MILKNGQGLLAANWKMNFGPAQALEMVQGLLPHVDNLSKSQVWVAAPAVSIAACSSAARQTPLWVGAQNVHWEESGAFTGELSIPMLREVGAQFAICGHSERRHVFAESNELVAKRVLAALSAEFPVIFCIGETLAEREAHRTIEVLHEQLEGVLSKLTTEMAQQLILAYEPVWAIGSGKVATVIEIEEAHTSVQDFWNKHDLGACPAILYGGSVKPDNYAEILQVNAVSGALVGGASLDLEKFLELLKISESA